MAVTASVTVEDGVYVFEISGSPTTNDCALPVLQYRSVSGYESYIFTCYDYVTRTYSTLIGPTKWYLYPLDYRSEKTGNPYDINLYCVVWATGNVNTALKQLQNESYRYGQAAPGGGVVSASNYYSNYYEAPSATPLATPTGLYADNITSDSARISWNAVENASGYKLEYRQSAGGGQTYPWIEASD